MLVTEQLLEDCRDYLAARKATYEKRRERFSYVANILVLRLGLQNNDTLFDLGAGHCQFDYYLRTECRWMGIYNPVDGAIDGTDLQTWQPPKVQPDFYVLSEIVEHLPRPLELLRRLKPRKGIVLTTPNADVVDVLTCDPDHHSIVRSTDLPGFSTRTYGFFGKADDTLIAWKHS